MGCFYMLGINPLSAMSFANVFSHLVACPFILSVDTFATQYCSVPLFPHLQPEDKIIVIMSLQ